MNAKYYHTPINSDPTRARCPVCREIAYSRGGIHPQCAAKQADPPKPKVKLGSGPAASPGPND